MGYNPETAIAGMYKVLVNVKRDLAKLETKFFMALFGISIAFLLIVGLLIYIARMVSVP